MHSDFFQGQTDRCLCNGTASFKVLFEYQHLLLKTSGIQSSILYLYVVHFFNTGVNKTSAAA
jgi:hypothetical protein